MLTMGVIFFIIAVIIDTVKLGKYKRADQKQPTWFPRYLNADADVL